MSQCRLEARAGRRPHQERLEMMEKVEIVVIDKTDTLTEGSFRKKACLNGNHAS
jgi:cation transport ATPase